ncbi:MAG TPA: VacJ family lipoprotein [Steroidobacteraceae bacterium]|nr:VacJ family lipoprotein [Steroidobacteraceae bacterium]
MLNHRTDPLRRIFIVLAFLSCAFSGCATTPGRTTHDDPWQRMNRDIYKFNDGLDRAVVKPTAKGYKAITPQWLRSGISRVFANLGYPVTMANQLLQAKPKLFVQDTCRFVTNTVVGLGGIFDVADKVGLSAHDEDFGQTLARWGVPSGPYLVLPFFGPSTVRDAPSRIADYFFSPYRYIDIPQIEKTGARALDVIDTRAQLLSTEGTLASAYDKYGVTRDAWLQRREYLIYDGNPPEEKIEEFDDSDSNKKP